LRFLFSSRIFISVLTESQIKDMRRKLDEQYKRDRETLDRMLDLMLRSNGGSTASSQQESVEAMTSSERISDLVLKIEGNFTMQDALKFIKESAPDFASDLTQQALSQGLFKMKKAGTIKIIIPKKGSSAAIYSKV
jgi:CHASE1-domain containing sensor protein